MNILITGGAGFIGSEVVRHFVTKYPQYRIFNLDSLTYAGNLENLTPVENADNYTFIKADIRDGEEMYRVFRENKIEAVIHLAAESHVDRSISDPNVFIETNVLGTANLLNAFRKQASEGAVERFYHVSTDEVYGSLGEEGLFTETTPYDPKSPYSASKASSDHFVRAYGNTYNLPFVISNCSNNYGPYQFPEKLIPLVINNIIEKKPLPIYGDGMNIRDWLHVSDHALAIDEIFHRGQNGETYNIGGLNEMTNIGLVRMLCQIMDEKLKREEASSENLITYVKDRAGHDQRYAIDCTKIMSELNWKPSVTFKEGLERTVDWYLNNTEWLSSVTSGGYKDYYDKHYNN